MTVTKIFEQSWSLLKQYDSNSLNYFWRNQRITLDDAAFDNKYVLKPNGSVDGYSREREIQKLMQLRQLSQGSSWIKTPEIDKKIIELMDTQWIPAIYEEPQDISAGQQEEQAVENAVMLDGFLPRVLPSDDHLVHLQMADGFIQWSQQNQRPIPPPQMQIFMQHMQGHVQAAQSNPQYWKAHAQQIAPFIEKVKGAMKAMQQSQAAGQQAGIAMQRLRGGGPPGMPSGGAAPGAPPPPNLPQAGMPAGAGPSGPPPIPGGNGQNLPMG